MKKLIQVPITGIFLLLSTFTFGQVVITPANESDLCTTAGGYTTLGNINIAETAVTDIDSSGTGSNIDTLTFVIDNGFEFNPAMTVGLSVNNGSDITTFTELFVGTDSAAYTYTVVDIISLDDFDITGIEVRAVTENVSGSITVNGDDINWVGTPTLLASLSSLEVPVINNGTTTAKICDGGQSGGFTLSSTVGGATFAWTTNATGISAGFDAANSGDIPDEALSLSNAATNGSLTYTVTPINGVCEGTPQDFVVNVLAVPSITNGVTTESLCSGNSSTGFTLTSDVGGATFAWTAVDFDVVDGYTTSGTNTIPGETLVAETPTSSVIYNATATNDICSGTSVDFIVSVFTQPDELSLDAGTGLDTILVCMAQDVDYTLSTNPSNITWNVASGSATIDGSSTNQTVTVDFNSSVSELVELEVTETVAPGCATTTTFPIEVFGCQFTGFGEGDIVCEGSRPVFQVPDVSPDIFPTYLWTAVSGVGYEVITGVDNTQASYDGISINDGTGNITVQLDLTYNGRTASIQQSATNNSLPTRVNAITGPDNVMCGQQNVNYTVGGTQDYTWKVYDLNDLEGDTVITQGVNNVDLDFNNNVGTAYISVRKVNNGGCQLEEAGQSLNFTGGGSDAYNIEKDISMSEMNSRVGSILMWVKTPNDWAGSYNESGIIYYGSLSGTNGYGENDDNVVELTLAIRNNKFVFDISENQNNQSLDLESDTQIQPNTWYHLGVTWNNAGNMNMYIDVTDADNYAPEKTVGYGTRHDFDFRERHRFGRGRDDSRRFVGEIDNVSLWTIELAKEDVFKYKEQQVSAQPGLFAYYPFDPEDALADASGNGYTLATESVTPTYKVADYFTDIKTVTIDAFEFNVGTSNNTNASSPYNGQLFFEAISGEEFTITNYNWTGTNYDGQDTAKALNTGTFLELTATNSAGCQFTASNTVEGAEGLSAGTIESAKDPGNFISSYCEGYELPMINSVVDADGGVGDTTYTWQYSFNNSTWFDIPSSNFASYQVLTLQTENVYIRRKVEDQSMPPEVAYSNSVFFIETQRDPLAASFGTDTSICNNADPYTLQISGASGGSTGIWVEDSNYVNSGGVFVPDSTIGGSSNQITYLQDKLGCADTLHATINIYSIQSTTLDVPDGELTTGSGEQAVAFTPSTGTGPVDSRRGLFYVAADSNDVFNNQITTLPLSDREIVPNDDGTSATLYPSKFDNSFLGETAFWIGYQHTDNNGCVTQAIDSLIILQEPGSISDRVYVCEYNSLVGKEAIGDDEQILTSQNLSTSSGFGIENVVQLSDRMIFDYNATLVDSLETDTIFYTYTYNTPRFICLNPPFCTSQITLQIPTISTITQVINIVRFDSLSVTTSTGVLDTSYCINEDRFLFDIDPLPTETGHQSFFTSSKGASLGRLSTISNTYEPQNNRYYTPGRFSNGGTEVLTYNYVITSFDNTIGSNVVCMDQIDFEVIVQELPEPEIDGLNDSLIYCSNSPVIFLTGNYSNQGTFSAPVSNGFLFPDILNDTTFVTYTYLDTTIQCANSVTDTILTFEKPETAIKGLDDYFCVTNNDEPYTLDGVVFSPDSTFGRPNGYFLGKGISDLSKDSEYDFLPSAMGVGDNQKISYIYTDNNGCTDTSEVFIDIKDVPSLSIDLTYNPSFATKLDTNLTGVNFPYICSYDGTPITAKGIASPTDANGIGALTIRGATIPGSQGNFIISNNDFGNQTITYEFTDSLGCYNSVDTTFFIHETPISRFSMINRCISDTIFFADSTIMRHPEETIEYWDFFYNDDRYANDSDDNNDTIQNPDVSTAINGVTTYHFFDEAETIQPSLTIITQYGCIDNADPIYLPSDDGRYTLNKDPEPDFIWSNECPDLADIFFDNTSREVDLNSPSTTYEWTYIGLTGADTFNESSFDQDGKGEFNSDSLYSVTLVVTSEDGCTGDTTKLIKTRPYFNTIEDIEALVDFEDGTKGWEIDTNFIDPAIPNSEAFNNNWELGFPTNKGDDGFDAPYSGSNAYFTKLNGDYDLDSRSYLTSGCYNLTVLDRPMISAQIISNLNQNDGVVLQFSLDSGATWSNLGQLTEDVDNGTFEQSGLNWFNSNNIAAEPNGDDRTGWTSRTRNDLGVGDWVSARHSLSSITNSKNVRFRFAFASNTNSSRNGFGIDDIQIKNRTRLVLTEHFLNSETLSSTSQDSLDQFMISRENPLDIVDIQYAYNVQISGFTNRDLVGQRIVDYGVPTQTYPYTVMDGSEARESSSSWLKDSLSTDLRTLIDAPVLLTNETPIVDLNVQAVSVDINITPVEDVFNDGIRLYGAIVEKGVTFNPNGTGDMTIRNFMRNTLGPINGIVITTPMFETDAPTQITLTGNIGLVSDTSKMAFVVYVRDEDTREVLQAHYIPVGTASIPTPLEDLVTGETYQYMLFPNPALDATNIIFETPLKDDYDVTLVDNLGNVVDVLTMEAGSRSLHINTASYSSGLYIMYISNGEQVLGVDKLVIQK